MIYDTLNHAANYKGISPALDAALDYIAANDLSALPDRMEIALGAYAMSQRPTLRAAADTVWEAHRRYIDIQIALTEGENIGYLPLSALTMEDYIPDRDVAFSHDATPGVSLTMAPGAFAVFFPQDAHRPCQGQGPVRKVVVKVPVTQD